MNRCTLVFMLMLLAMPLASAQNLIVNGSFDDLIFQEPTGGTSIPDGWRRYTFGNPDGTYVVTDPGGNAVDGQNYLQIGAFNSLVQVITTTIAPNTTYNLAAFARTFGATAYDVRVYAMTDPLEVLYTNSTELGRVQFGIPAGEEVMTEKTAQFTPAAEHVGKFMGIYIAGHAQFAGFDNVRLTVVPSAGNADFDGDSDVDGSDFLTWQRNVGASSPSQMQGNANGDAAVDGADLAIWKSQFSAAAAVVSASAVPEPAGAVMLGVALISTIRTRRTK